MFVYRKSSNSPPFRAYLFLGFLQGRVFGHTPIEIFLLEDYFFNARHARNRIFFKGQANCR